MTSEVPLVGIANLVLTVENSGTTAMTKVVTENASIPPDRTIALVFSADRRGSLKVTVDAFDTAGKKLAHGTGADTIAPSRLTQITVILESTAIVAGDGGTPDF